LFLLQNFLLILETIKILKSKTNCLKPKLKKKGQLRFEEEEKMKRVFLSLKG